ncbi:hypothetical protein [Aurantimonas endophytica]|uniref:Uncharacterized protein n=1 Tax=Aurantimonas endophytica TaxID=1522175 RepID=A0A7W6HEA3_9HYPH|nr:hypothetical protein [Aurantimonas endophytica]MBB4003629.1 hypothetical protein [Aurantimonas endophytica]MCO6404487.1 hypothetical protein [Aurantimonas endophytica]
MTHQQDASRTWGEAEWLPRLICCCRDLPDIVKFARVASRSPAQAACFYGSASPLRAVGEGDVVIDMGLVSADQAMLEAEFASMVCADLSLACAVDVSRDAGIAWVGPGATYENLMRSCRDQQMMPRFAGQFPHHVHADPLLSVLLCDPTPLSRLQRVSLCGNVQWLDLRGEPEMLELLCAGTPEIGIISRLELRLQPLNDCTNPSDIAALDRGRAPTAAPSRAPIGALPNSIG